MPLGDVGDFGEAEFFTPSDVVSALSQLGRTYPVLVVLNSGGGDAMAGLTIYNRLAAHQGRVTVEVDGIAASAASLTAMAGNRLVMKAGALMMVHDPRAITVGNLAEHARSVEMLDKMSEQYASVYAKKSRKSVSAVRNLMEREIWLTADQAVREGSRTTPSRCQPEWPHLSIIEGMPTLQTS